MSRYHPKRDDCKMAYVIAEHSWGKTTEHIRWAFNLKDAKAKYGWTRQLHASRTVRRATTEEVERLPEYRF